MSVSPCSDARRPRWESLDRHHEQLPRERWHDYLEDPTVADAILDRLVPARIRWRSPDTHDVRAADAETIREC